MTPTTPQAGPGAPGQEVAGSTGADDDELAPSPTAAEAAGAHVTDPGIDSPQAQRAAVLLFGSAAKLREPDWKSELKRAYRERVLQSHPDRAAALGRPAGVLEREFRAVNDAFELLQRVTGQLPPVPPAPAPAPPQSTATRTRGGEARRGSAAWRQSSPGAGPLPARQLRLAELLHHLRLIRSADVAAAVAWQRAQRPMVGRLAESFGYLDRAAVAAILGARAREGASRERFAAFAVARGRLTPFQRLVVLGQQRREQRPIGVYFLERGLCTEAQLEEACATLLCHNLRHAA